MFGLRQPKRRLLDVVVLVGIVLGAVGVSHCQQGAGTTSPVDPAEARAVLGNLAENVLRPSYERFATLAAALEQACDTYATSLDAADRAAARDAWIEAMDAWQRLEMMQIGPAAPVTRPGGRGLRDEVDSWPLTNECRIDEEIVEANYVDREAFALELVNVRGLDAMEYLLFHESADNACGALAEINTSGAWAALGAVEIDRRRAVYAATLAHLVRAQADALANAWRSTGEDYAGLLARSDAAPYPDHATGLNAVSDALFYLELVTKDQKLAATTREATESPHALRSRENVATNLRAFEEIFLGAPPGTDAPGFDDLLASLGEAATAERIATLVDGAEAAVAAIDEPIETALTNQPAAVVAAHDAVRLVTDELKGRFLTTLRLRVPAEASGDAD